MIMRSFKFNVGDLLRLNGRIDGISPVGCPEKTYTHSLRVDFRFWDGTSNVYVVTAGDGIGLVVLEDDMELQEAAGSAVAGVPQEPGAQGELYSLTRDEMLVFAERITFHLDDRLVPFSRETLRSEAWLLGYEFAKSYNKKED